ncbi:MAG: methyltransferase [Gammaproteobacteria bacterium]|nr:methyltransferase [Gammaproteobacteria bacterium]
MPKALLSMILLVVSAQLFAADAASTRSLIESALQSSIRESSEIARDPNRKPTQALSFFGLDSGMKVLELSPASGYWSKILGPVLCSEDGQLVFAIGLSETFKNEVMALPGLECTSAINEELTLLNIPEFSFAEADFDLILTFWNLHNLNDERRNHLNRAAFKALKSDGVYGIVDHTRRHMQPDNRAIGRRLDPVVVIKELTELGFEFEDYSPLHYHPEDDLEQEVGTPGIRGNTDRFTLKFRKP